MAERVLLVFTKPARAGRVKTRLIGALSAEQAAELHAALLADLLDRLQHASVSLRVAWMLEPGDESPDCGFPIVLQRGADIGARMFNALAEAAGRGAIVGVVGSDLPELTAGDVERAFRRIESGDADIVLGPAADGGYYLLVVRRDALDAKLFENVPWSTPQVLDRTLAQCKRLGLRWSLLRQASDLDWPSDLERVSRQMAAENIQSPRAARLLRAWGMVTAKEGA